VLVSGFAKIFQIKRCDLSASANNLKEGEIALTTYRIRSCDVFCGFWHGSAQTVLFRKATTPKENTMNDPTRTTKPNTDEIPHEMLDLTEAINSLPEGHRTEIEPFITRVIESTRRRRRILSLVQDALSQLRLDMKYLAFDLEATRRERDDYRQKLEEAS
jgi:hypothetical protein